MVASSAAGSAASVRSRGSLITTATTARTTSKTAAPPPPHILGGSKNLMSERFRREQAEQTLQKTRQSLKAVTTDLMPQVDELSKAVKMMQIEKHHQLDLDETSQQVLEELQQQIYDLDARDAQFAKLLDDRMDLLLAQVQEKFQAEKYELHALVSQVQESQETVLSEVRLLHHEICSTKQFLAKQVDNMDDAIDLLRKELARAKDHQALTNQNIQQIALEMDEKLFLLDKELLKLKLVLPSSVSAQMPPKFANGLEGRGGEGGGGGAIEPSRSRVGMNHQLQECQASLAAVKAELVSYRHADRQQFDAITNRLRESTKTQQSLGRELDTRFHEIQRACDSMTTKVPSELSKRFLQAQAQWQDELGALRARVDQLGVVTTDGKAVGGEGLYGAAALRSMDTAIHRHGDTLEEVQSSLASLKANVETMYNGHETTTDALRSAVGRLEQDILGMYDWTKRKMANLQDEITFTANVLTYFQQNAKILPK